MKTIRTAVLAATAALFVMPAVQAGGLGGALGGTVGGAMSGSLGGAFGGSGGAAGSGESRFGAPDLGRPLGRIHQTGDAAADHGATVAGKARDRAANAQGAADGKASGAVGGALSGAKDSMQAAPTAASTSPAPSPEPAPARSLSADGLLGGSAGAETPRHEARVEGAGAGSVNADRSGADAKVAPSASAHAGRKALPAPSGDATPQ